LPVPAPKIKSHSIAPGGSLHGGTCSELKSHIAHGRYSIKVGPRPRAEYDPIQLLYGQPAKPIGINYQVADAGRYIIGALKTALHHAHGDLVVDGAPAVANDADLFPGDAQEGLYPVDSLLQQFAGMDHNQSRLPARCDDYQSHDRLAAAGRGGQGAEVFFKTSSTAPANPHDRTQEGDRKGLLLLPDKVDSYFDRLAKE
jgi:hypothetical protein